MNLTVLGATGPTGTQLVEQALAAGHHVTALARSPEKLTITNPNLHVVQGDATDRAAVSQAMKGADAVISTLGAKGSVIAASARAIVAVAKQEGPQRIVMLSSFAVARDRLKAASKLLTGNRASSSSRDALITPIRPLPRSKTRPPVKKLSVPAALTGPSSTPPS